MASDDNHRAERHFRRGFERLEDDNYDGAIAEFSEYLRSESCRCLEHSWHVLGGEE